MLFEILSTGSMLAVAGSAYYFKNNSSSNDHDKIKKIADEAGLKTKEGSIRIYRRNNEDDYTEYIYKIPLGLSFKEFEDKKQLFIDGLNNKSRPDLNLKNIKNIDWKGDILKQFKDLINNRVPLNKQIELSYDGMLKFKVFDEGLGGNYPLTEELMSKCKDWTVPIGVTLSEIIHHDFESQSGAHMLLGGATDMGKSTVLNGMINTLIYNHPDDVEFTLIDLKGGLEFGAYKNLKQVKNFAKNLNDAESALNKLQEEMEDTFELLERKGKKKVKDLGIKKRHFIIIDEAAELSSDNETDKEVKQQKIRCENYIKDISRRGRASGMKLIYSTQNPTAEVIGSQTKRNLVTRLCLAVDTSTASIVVLDEGGAEKLPLIQGRAIYKRHRSKTIQAFHIHDDLSEKITRPHVVIKAKEEKEDTHAPSKSEKHETAGEDTIKFEAI